MGKSMKIMNSLETSILLVKSPYQIGETKGDFSWIQHVAALWWGQWCPTRGNPRHFLRRSLVVFRPSEKSWTSSVWMMTFSINMESHKIPWFQTTNQLMFFCFFWVILGAFWHLLSLMFYGDVWESRLLMWLKWKLLLLRSESKFAPHFLSMAKKDSANDHSICGRACNVDRHPNRIDWSLVILGFSDDLWSFPACTFFHVVRNQHGEKT